MAEWKKQHPKRQLKTIYGGRGRRKARRWAWSEERYWEGKQLEAASGLIWCPQNPHG